jgi:GT2 family glycosyltransferase
MNFAQSFAADRRHLEAEARAWQDSRPDNSPDRASWPLISLIVPLYNTNPDFLRQMIASVQAQDYPNWQLCLADGSDATPAGCAETVHTCAGADTRIRYRRLPANLGISGNTNAALELATGDYLALLDHDDLLAPEALSFIRHAINSQGADLIYTDELNFADNLAHIRLIHYKPDFSRDNLRSNNYICHLTAFSRQLAESIGPFDPACDGSQDYDYILRLSEAARKIVHIPHILYYWRVHSGSVAADLAVKPYCLAAARLALHKHLQRLSLPGQVEDSTILSTYRIRYQLPPGQTALVLLTVSSSRQLRRIGTLLNTPAGLPAFFLIFARRPLTCRLKNTAQSSPHWKTSSIRPTDFYPDNQTLPALFNQETKTAREPLIALLDGCVRSLSPDWLSELARYAARQDTGLACGKITSHGLICQAGLGTGFQGGIDGYHNHRVDGEPGYMARLTFANQVALADRTLAVLRTETLRAAGGFATCYRQDCFDLDLALTLSQMGYQHIFTPDVTAEVTSNRDLIATRLRSGRADPADTACFQNHWQTRLSRPDPWSNPKLNQKRAWFDLL